MIELTQAEFWVSILNSFAAGCCFLALLGPMAKRNRFFLVVIGLLNMGSILLRVSL